MSKYKILGLIVVCLSLTNVSFSQGYWNTPANFGVSNYVTSQLNDVHFVDATTVIAVGKEGTILKSDDGGITWRGIPSGTQNELTSLDFISASEGFIMGTFSTCLKTTDGGETWNSISNLSGSTYFYDVKMLSSSNIIGVGLLGVIFKSTDGGFNWNLVPSGNSNSFYSVDFISATEGFVVGSSGTILKTVDAGNTWQSLTSGTFNSLNKVKFISATEGFVVGSTGTILKTIDGGTNWSIETSGITATLEDIHFYSATEGWAVGDFGKLIFTLDGGVNWNEYVGLTSKKLNGIHFGNSTHAIVVGNQGFIGSTADAGVNWDIILNSDFATTQLNAISFPTSEKGWVAGNSGAILTTTDKGINWNSQTSGTAQNLNDIFFLDELKGWACGTSGTNLSTIDGGVNWIINSPLSGNLNAIHFCNCLSEGWMVGSNGNIYKTIDGGTTWSPQTSGTSQTLNGVYFIDNINGWAVGNAGTILHTNDGGNNWVAQTSGITNDLNEVSFVSFFVGWATGLNGTVLYTDNGGASWSLMNNNISNLSVNGISHLSQNSVWIGCNNGVVYRTKNKGMNWDYQYSSNSINVNDIHMNTFKEGCAVGASGKIVLYRCGTPTPTGNSSQSFCFSASISSLVVQGDNIIWYDQPSGGTILSADLPLQNGVTYYAAQNIDDCESASRLAVSVTVLNEGNPISTNFTTQPSTCNSSAGSASVIISGGTSPYNYLWDNGNTTNQTQNLNPGIHYLTIEDNVGCTFFTSFQILSVGGPVISLISLTNNVCAKGSTGAIDISVTGGQAPYDFEWNNHQTTEDISSLAYGCYEVKVSDALGCVASDNFFIDEPSSLYINYQINQPTCLLSNGSILIANGGGISPYSYAWNTGATSMNLSSISAGSYVISVTDANGCVISKQISLNDLEGEYIILEELSIDDCNSNDASAYVYVSGNNNTYLWSDNSTNEDLLNVAYGNYTLEVTNDFGCKSFSEFALYPETTSLVGLCMVSVDEPTQHNILIWEKPSSGDIAFFNIYKESCMEGVFHLIHTQPYADESLFEDSIANADVRGWRYKISTVNSCGVESELSNAHRTVQIMVTENGGTYNLKWTEYEGLYIYLHDVYRSTTSLGEQLVGSFQFAVTNTTTDTPPASDDLKYYVVVDPFITCTSSRANINTSRSNSKGIAAPVDGVEETINGTISIYPNPTTSLLNVVLPVEFMGSSFSIINTLGQTLFVSTLNSTQHEISLSEFSNGIYYFQLITDKGTITKKVVKN